MQFSFYKIKQGDKLKAIIIFIFIMILGGLKWSKAELYSFTDEKGIIHYSNIPSDSRYEVDSRLENLNSSSDLYKKEIKRAAFKYDLNPALIKAVIQAESKFDHLATSSVGAEGLMQLMPQTAKHLKVNDSYDPKENIDGGARHLRRLLNLFNGDLKLSIAAYNAGENAVLKYNGIPPYGQTERFVEKVLHFYKKFKKEKEEGAKVYKFVDMNGTSVFTNTPRKYKSSENWQVE